MDTFLLINILQLFQKVLCFPKSHWVLCLLNTLIVQSVLPLGFLAKSIVQAVVGLFWPSLVFEILLLSLSRLAIPGHLKLKKRKFWNLFIKLSEVNKKIHSTFWSFCFVLEQNQKSADTLFFQKVYKIQVVFLLKKPSWLSFVVINTAPWSVFNRRGINRSWRILPSCPNHSKTIPWAFWQSH